MKLVACLCIYNEVQFIAETLDALIQIQDLDQIHIKDGAWHGGVTVAHMRSTDGTIEAINQWRMKHRERNVSYSWVQEIYASESRKRNAQLAEIEQIHGPDTVAFVINGDELVRFPTGLTEIWVKDDLHFEYEDVMRNGSAEVFKRIPTRKRTNLVGMVKTFAWNDEKELWSPRFIPLGQGFHYHTEIPMIIHDKDCHLVSDYHPKYHATDPKRSYPYDRLFLVNQWPKRKPERMAEKEAYCAQIEAINPDTPCQYNSEKQ